MINYCERIQQSIDYIEEHLQDKLDIRVIANNAYFSITHYYRIFQAMVGDSVKDYVRKRRLSKAAVELVSTDKRIIDIAFDYDFESQEVFTRAFIRLFDVTPGRYRKRKSNLALYEKANIYLKDMAANANCISSRFVIDKEFKVVGIKKWVKPEDGSISKEWKEFNRRRHEIEHVVNDNVVLGMCEYMPDVTEESTFLYITCIEVEDFCKVPDGMITKIISPIKYVVFTHKGRLEELRNTYAYIYGTWLPHTGYELVELETIELYDNRSLDPNSKDFEFDIYIPIK